VANTIGGEVGTVALGDLAAGADEVFDHGDLKAGDRVVIVPRNRTFDPAQGFPIHRVDNAGYTIRPDGTQAPIRFDAAHVWRVRR
jgi:hypothetical protein